MWSSNPTPTRSWSRRTKRANPIRRSSTPKKISSVPDEDDDDDVVVDEEEEDEDEVDEAPTTRTKKRAAGEEEDDEDDDLLSPDDVEADLDRILKDRMVTVEEEDDDEEVEPDERGEGVDRLQPKRAGRAAVPELLPARPCVRTGVPRRRRRLPDLLVMSSTATVDPVRAQVEETLRQVVDTVTAVPCELVRRSREAAGRAAERVTDIGRDVGRPRSLGG